MAKWVYFKLPEETENLFYDYCRTMNIRFEMKGIINMTQFRCLMDNEEITKANNFISVNC